MDIKVILMDIGGVVLLNTATEDDFEQFSKKFAAQLNIDPQAITTIRKAHLQESLLGTYSIEQFFADVATEAGVTFPEDIMQVWTAAVLPEIKINTDLLQWIDEARKKCQVVVFSTISPLRLLIDEGLGIYQHFDRQFLSSKLGLTKADPEFYKHAVKEMRIEPEQALLIDDQPSNIERAKSLGINGLLYKTEYFYSPDQFLKDIAVYNL